MPDRREYAFSPVNTVFVLYGQCTKKGLGRIKKGKTREIECFARIEISVRQ